MELQDQLINVKVENLKLEEECRRLENKLKLSEVSRTELEIEIGKL
jgi:hypothetical protein